MGDDTVTESVTIRRQVVAGEDSQGNPTYTTQSITVPGCGVGWNDSGEDVAAFGTRAMSGATVYAPPGTVFLPSDLLTIRGVDYSIVGDAPEWVSYYTETPKGVVVGVKRAS